MSEPTRDVQLGYRRLAAAHGASAAGDTLIAIALAGTLFFNVPIGQARTRVALYLVLTMAPFALLAPVVGPMIDRRRGGHRAAIVLAATARAVLALFMTSTKDTLLLYPSAFGVLVLSRAHSVARSALLPTVIPQAAALVPANARLARVSVLGGALAALPGIVAQRIAGAGVVLTMSAGMFALVAAAGLALPRPARRAPRNHHPGIAIGGVPAIWRALVVNAVIRGTSGFLLFLLAFGLRRQGVGAAGFALVLGASGLGAYIGATIVPRLRRGGNEEWVLAVALLLGSGAAIISSRAFGTDLAAFMGAIVGILTNGGRLALDSLTQRLIVEAARARMFARFETLLQLSWVSGAMVPVLIPIGVEIGLGMASAAYLGAAIWFFVSLGSAGRRGLSA